MPTVSAVLQVSDQNSLCFPTDAWICIFFFFSEKQLSLPIDRVVSFKYGTIFSLITRLLHGDILDKAYEGEQLSHQGWPGCVPDRHLYKGGRTLQCLHRHEYLTVWWWFTLTFLFSESYSFKNFEVRYTFTFTVMNMRALLTWWRRTFLLLSVHWNEQSTHPYTKQTNTSPLSFSDECESGIYLNFKNWNILSPATVTVQ